MTMTPNWQHHSRKEQKRKLKPQALRDAKRRRSALKAKLQGGQDARSSNLEPLLFTFS